MIGEISSHVRSRPSSVVIISSGPVNEPAAPDEKLLATLGKATRVLEIGRPDSELGLAYRAQHPNVEWLRVGPDNSSIDTLDTGFDLLVLSDGLPEAGVVQTATAKTTPGARLFAAVNSAACWAALARVMEADVDSVASPLSPASAYKRLLDAGWMPTLADQYTEHPPSQALAAAAQPLAEALGVPHRTAGRSLGMTRAIIQAVRTFDDAPRHAGSALFSVVVPTTRESQLRANVEQSPGIHEVNAKVISYRGAQSPAEALDQSLAYCESDWVVFCHQDVYFPRGFGEQLNAVLAQVPANERPTTLFGFIGIGSDRASGLCAPAGFVIDRLHRADHPASDTAISIDELAIVIARDSVHKIDPLLGWHLWATDLCLAAISSRGVHPRIVRIPLFHNSTNDYELPPAFATSARILKQKYPGVGPIHTLCGTIA
jgi:hypothetical protein